MAEGVAVFRLTTEVVTGDAWERLRDELWAVAQSHAGQAESARLRQSAETWELPADEAREWLALRPVGWKPAG